MVDLHGILLARKGLWEIVAGGKTTPLQNVEAWQKWKIQAEKALFAIKTSIEEEMLEHIRRVDTPKVAWDTYLTLFSKKNDVRLQYIALEWANASGTTRYDDHTILYHGKVSLS